MHVALLGDSILDNHAYTKGAPDVAGHLRQLLPGSAQATLCAVDGSTTSDLNLQIARVPSDASHIVISIGGNDALLNSDLLSTPVASTTEALSLYPPEAYVARMALMMFNDVILRFGFERTLTIIDLRFVCSEKADYANLIEPSGKGGLKIATAIVRWLNSSEPHGSAHVFTG